MVHVRVPGGVTRVVQCVARGPVLAPSRYEVVLATACYFLIFVVLSFSFVLSSPFSLFLFVAFLPLH